MTLDGWRGGVHLRRVLSWERLLRMTAGDGLPVHRHMVDKTVASRQGTRHVVQRDPAAFPALGGTRPVRGSPQVSALPSSVLGSCRRPWPRRQETHLTLL